MADFWEDLPKAELHLHLEGAAPPAAPFDDFAGFIECFKQIVQELRDPGDYVRLFQGLIRRLAEENVRYAEITLSAGVILWKKQEFEPVFAALRAATAEADLPVRWIFDAVRHFGPKHAMQVAELAAAHVNEGVVAFGIGGDEERGPAKWFGDVFAYARGRGLRLTAHAGETCGPESIWAALEIGAERIGHGIRAIDDPVLVRHLGDRAIPLEICISSNVATGAAASLAAHPIRRLYDAGVPVTLATDDPGIFSTTLNREYALAHRHFGFSETELREIAENGFRFAFKSGA
jgi:aminodeoxyfutalosine deaminase